jgi:uncharacterized iron-regulated protein
MATEHYLPLFHFARINRIPMLALNVERELVQSVRARGLDGVPPEKREGLTVAAPALFEHYIFQTLRVGA